MGFIYLKFSLKITLLAFDILFITPNYVFWAFKLDKVDSVSFVVLSIPLGAFNFFLFVL